MHIIYKTNEPISAAQFIDLLQRSTLAARRPVDDPACIQGMLDHANLLVTAWDGETLVGTARSLTDFHYACYLSDLAVDEACQRQGIGRELMQRTQAALGPRCKIVLLAAPAAVEYYPRLGLERHPSAWTLPRHQQLR
ncbi:MAG: GNAT family N-acetyltransferase [Caldilineales bacterium]|nr:GNAT family N-acetyltransferase [Caldilineales bacterium]